MRRCGMKLVGSDRNPKIKIKFAPLAVCQRLFFILFFLLTTFYLLLTMSKPCYNKKTSKDGLLGICHRQTSYQIVELISK